jgi:hypothetical protein
MWGYACTNDFAKHRHEHSISDFTTIDVRKQMSVHFFSLLVSIVLFATTMLVPWHYASNGTHHWPTSTLWLLAVFVEQVGNSSACVFFNLPFPAMYAGSRMQAWVMLCFGESVIALLIEPIFFDKSQFSAISAAFVMLLCLCITYFDIVDADQFLHIFMVRNEKWKAFLLMNFQLLFSFSVFLVGVSLKTIIYVSNMLYYFEIDSGCGVSHHHEAPHRLLSTSSNNNHYDGGRAGHLRGAAGSAPPPEKTAVLESSRRLATTSNTNNISIYDLDDKLFKSFLMLTISASMVMMFSIFIG